MDESDWFHGMLDDYYKGAKATAGSEYISKGGFYTLRNSPSYKSATFLILTVLRSLSHFSPLQLSHLSNHGPGHDSALGRQLSSLLEGDDHAGGEGPAGLQRETALLWKNGAQVPGSHGHEPQGAGEFTVLVQIVNISTQSLQSISLCFGSVLKLPAFKYKDRTLNESYAAILYLEVRTWLLSLSLIAASIPLSS